MKRLLGIVLATFTLLCVWVPGVFAQDDGARVIVCIGGGESVAAQEADGLNWSTLMDVSTQAEAGGLSAQAEGKKESKTLMLVTSDTLTNDELIAKLEQRSDVLFAEADQAIRLDEEMGTANTVAEASLSTSSTQDYSKFQWFLNNDGKMSAGKLGYDVGNTAGLTGKNETVIAVMDTGIDYNNPNLTGQIIDLSTYAKGQQLMDDTGAVVHGYCASENADNDIMDTDGHGTHCAGIIAADGTEGISGVMTQNVKVVGTKVMGDKGYIYFSSMIKAWAWLVSAKTEYDIPIRGVNVSIGGTFATRSMALAIKTADNAGITTIFASGNDSLNIDMEEADTNFYHIGSTLVVNAMEASGQEAPYSNYGLRTTDIYAPGSSILSTAASKKRTFNAFTAALDTSRIVVYEGCEAAGETDSDDPDKNGGLTFHYYDASKADNCGEAVAAGEDYFYGSQGLTIPAGGETTVTLISETTDLSSYLKEGQLYRGYSMHSPMGRTQITCDYKLKDGSFSSTTAENMGAFQWRNSGNASNGGSDLQELPDNVDFENFQMKITLTFTDTQNTLALDSIGIGTGLDDSTLYGGTSMAAPATTGVFALLASNHPEEVSAKIAARIVGGAKDNENFAGKCISGGQLNIDGANSDPLPVIQDSAVSGQTVLLKGWFFGSKPGSVTIGGQAAQITRWQEDTDTTMGSIEIKAPSGLSGMQTIVVTDQDNQSGHIDVDLLSDGGFTDLALPSGENYDDTVLANLAAIDDTLYLLSMDSDDQSSLWKYDSKEDTWQYLSKGPEIFDTSCQMFGYRGKLYYKDAFISGYNILGQLKVYDPQTKLWQTVKTQEDLLFGATAVVYKDQLLFVGGYAADLSGASKAIYRVDPDSGTVEKIGELPEEAYMVSAVASGDTLMVLGGYNNEEKPLNKLFCINFKEETKTYGMPNYDTGQDMGLAVGGTGEGLIVSGPVVTTDGTLKASSEEVAGGHWQDTWCFNKVTGEWRWSGKTLSATKTYRSTGVQVGDSFYVWGKNAQVPELTFFRKTAIEGPSPTPTVEPTPTSTPLPSTTMDTATPLSANSATGIQRNSNAIFIAAGLCIIAAAGIIGYIIYNRKKRS